MSAGNKYAFFNGNSSPEMNSNHRDFVKGEFIHPEKCIALREESKIIRRKNNQDFPAGLRRENIVRNIRAN
jgi:hypothetical protein